MKTATFNQAMRWIILGSLLLAAACAEGGESSQTRRASTYNKQYYPDYYGPSDYPNRTRNSGKCGRIARGAAK